MRLHTYLNRTLTAIPNAISPSFLSGHQHNHLPLHHTFHIFTIRQKRCALQVLPNVPNITQMGQTTLSSICDFNIFDYEDCHLRRDNAVYSIQVQRRSERTYFHRSAYRLLLGSHVIRA